MIAKASQHEQGSYQWLVDRIGYTSSSNIAKIMAKGSGATRANYMARMICEVLTGVPVQTFKSSAMNAGNEREPPSRALYERITGNVVGEVGFHFIESEHHGSSSDGLVNDNGLVEIKNVIPAEQIRLLASGKRNDAGVIEYKIKTEYIKQMQDQMYVYERDWCDFVQTSFGDEELGTLPAQHRIKIIRVERDEQMIAEIRKEVAKFHDDMKILIDKLREV